MGVKLRQVIEKLAFPYSTCAGVQLAINVKLLLQELELQGVKINNLDCIKNINSFDKVKQQKRHSNMLRCLKCNNEIEQLLFKKIQLCKKCHAR